MGGSASSEVAMGDEGIKKQAQTNIGLLTLASESQAGGFNLLEIATCIIAVMILLYLLRWCCIKHWAKKMERLRAQGCLSLSACRATHGTSACLTTPPATTTTTTTCPPTSSLPRPT